MYQQEVTALIEAADELIAEREPVAALSEWLMLFVEFLDAKHGMAAAMDTLIGGPEPIYSKTTHRLDVPVKALVSRGVATGVFRDDIEPHDLLRALSRVAHVRLSKNWKLQAVRMVDILLCGLQLNARDHDYRPLVLAREHLLGTQESTRKVPKEGCETRQIRCRSGLLLSHCERRDRDYLHRYSPTSLISVSLGLNFPH